LNKLARMPIPRQSIARSTFNGNLKLLRSSLTWITIRSSNWPFTWLMMLKLMTKKSGEQLRMPQSLTFISWPWRKCVNLSGLRWNSSQNKSLLVLILYFKRELWRFSRVLLQLTILLIFFRVSAKERAKIFICAFASKWSKGKFRCSLLAKTIRKHELNQLSTSYTRSPRIALQTSVSSRFMLQKK